MTVWESVRNMKPKDSLAEMVNAVGRFEKFRDAVGLGPKHDPFCACLEYDDVMKATAGRALKLGIAWGTGMDPHEQARCCECMGWTDLAERWRRLA